MKYLKLNDNYAYLHYKTKVIFSYRGFIRKHDWAPLAEYQYHGLLSRPAGFAGQFLFLHWNYEQNKNLVDIETYKVLYDIDTQLGVKATGQLHNCLQ